MKKINYKKAFSLLLIALLTVPTIAAAQTVFEPVAGDISIKIISQLFGDLVNKAGITTEITGQDPILNAITTFNACVLMVGGILAAYTILLGVVGTAHDGEMLGKSLSSAFVPIRYVGGVVLVLPVIGGYAIIQLLVMWLVGNGIGLADNVWLSFAKQPISPPTMVLKADTRARLFEESYKLFNVNYCLASYKNAVSRQKGSENFISQIGWTTGSTDSSWKRFFGSDAVPHYVAGLQGSLATYGCGEVMKLDAPEAEIIETGKAGTTNYGYLGDLSGTFGNTVIDTTDLHNQYFNTIFNNLNSLTTKLADEVIALSNEGKLTDDKAEEIGLKLIKEVESTVDTIQASGKEVANEWLAEDINMERVAERSGWLMAGSWFMRLANLQQRVVDELNYIPITVIDNPTPVIQNLMKRQGENNFKVAVDRFLTKKGAFEIEPFVNKDGDFKPGSESAFANSLSSKVAEIFTGIDVVNLRNDNRHPIVIITQMGSNLLQNASAAAIGITITSALAGVSIMGNSIGAAAAVNAFSSFATPLIATLWTVGFTATNLIPMLPFIIWLGAIIGWLILVIEAIIAAPLWAVMHLHPQGSDLVGKGGAGYSLVLALLLRPVLLVFGFIAAVVLTGIVGEFINKIFFEVWSVSTGGSTGLMGTVRILFGLVMYVTIMITFITKMFSVSTLIADQLLKWIGGPTEQLGAFAGEFAQRGGQTMLAAAAFTNQAGTAVIRGSGKMANMAGGGGKGLMYGNNSADTWLGKNGGTGGLTGKEKAAAMRSYTAWVKSTGGYGKSFEDYVSYRQQKYAEQHGGDNIDQGADSQQDDGHMHKGAEGRRQYEQQKQQKQQQQGQGAGNRSTGGSRGTYSNWQKQTGGFAALSAADQASAKKQHQMWQEKKGGKWGLEDYVNYVQEVNQKDVESPQPEPETPEEEK